MNKEPRKIIERKRKELTGGWEEWRKEKLVLFAGYCWDGLIKANEMRGTCSTHRRDEK